MEDQLRDQLSEAATEATEQATRELREAYLAEVSRAGQGADGLADFVGPVKQRRNARGQFESGFEFRVQHPFASLHESGGYIEPTYTNAKVGAGWTRDEMYAALEDCNEYVRRKRLLARATERIE